MSSAGDRLRLKRAMSVRFDERQPDRRRFRATIGDGAGNVCVPGKKNHVYMRREGRSLVEDVLNVNVPARNGMPVICGCDSENPDMLQILAVDWQSIKDAESFTYLPMHHESHELLNPDGGDDIVWVQKSQVVPLGPFPTAPASMQIWVQSDYYPWDAGWNRWGGGLTADLATYLPHAYSCVYVLVSIDGATNALQYTAGTEFPLWPPPAEEDMMPAAPAGSVPVVAVYLWTKESLLPNDPGLVCDSFETPGGGGPDIWASWTETVGVGALANDAVIFYAAGGGINSCQTTEGGGGRDTYVYQDFAVTAGNCYQLRFWTRDDGGANDGAYRVYDVTNGADIVATTGTGVIGGPTWTEVTQTFTAPEGCATARVYLYCPAAGASQAWFDDVTVAEGPCSLGWSNLRDVRLFNSPMPGSVAPAPHSILSASHDDSTAAVVQRGDLMTGQGLVPTWTRLAHPGGDGYAFVSGANEPGWDDTPDWQGEHLFSAGAKIADDQDLTFGDGDDATIRYDEAGDDRVEVDGADWSYEAGVSVNFEQEITQAEQAGDPGAPGAGYGRSYFKDDGGQTKEYFQDDAGNVYEKAGIVEDVTVTVGGAGDFATIQGAIDWFKNWIIKGACAIDCDADAYDEAVVFADLLICPGSTLTLEGDTRDLAGMSFVDGASINRAGIANGGSGTGTLTTFGNVILVTATVANPDFQADGWVNGDRILVYDNTGTIGIYTIDSTLANAITLTVAAPNVGNDGTAICLLPDRSIDRTAAGRCILVDGVRGVSIDGWYLETATGADCDGVRVQAGGYCTIYNTAAMVEDNAFRSQADYSAMAANTGAVSAWDCYSAFWAVNTAQITAQYAVAVVGSRPFYSQAFSYLNASYATAIAATTAGFFAREMGMLYAYGATARQCIIGYYGYYRAYLYAAVTNANNNGNGANYNPAVSDAWGNSNASITWS